MFVIEKEILIDASVEEVFEFVTRLENIPRWAPNIGRIERLSSGPLSVGTRFIEFPDLPLGAPEVHWEITGYDPPRTCSYAGESFLGRSHVTFALEMRDDGTLLAAEVQGDVRPPLRVFEPLMRTLARRDRAHTLARIKELLESGDGAYSE